MHAETSILELQVCVGSVKIALEEQKKQLNTPIPAHFEKKSTAKMRLVWSASTLQIAKPSTVERLQHSGFTKATDLPSINVCFHIHHVATSGFVVFLSLLHAGFIWCECVCVCVCVCVCENV